MYMNYNDGILFMINNVYIEAPRKYDFIYLTQLMEVCYEYGGFVREHIQPHNEISYIISGSGTFITNGKKEKVKAGDIHIISKGESHAVIADQNSKLRFVCFGFLFDNCCKGELLDMVEFFSCYRYGVLHDRGNIRFAIDLLVPEIYSVEWNTKYIVEACLKQILTYTYRLYKETYNTGIIGGKYKNSTVSPRMVHTIMRYIDDRIYSINSVSDICENVGYSQSYVSRIFNKFMGMGIKEYINHRKIDIAKYLMKTERVSNAEICERLNFESPQYFCKIFKKYVGITTTEFRKRNLTGGISDD